MGWASNMKVGRMEWESHMNGVKSGLGIKYEWCDK